MSEMENRIEDKIADLLEIYFEGETSLEEEKVLKTYFQQSEIDDKFRRYQPLFVVLKNEKALEMRPTVSINLNKTIEQKQDAHLVKPFFRIQKRVVQIAAAAAIILAVSLVTFMNWENPKKPQTLAQHNPKHLIFDENDDPQLAFEAAQKALMLISKKMQKGEQAATKTLKKVKKATDEIDGVIDIK
jgi:hypothetical protein